VHLLGGAVVIRGVDRVELTPGKATALLLMLTHHGGWVRRGEIVQLFWPDAPEDRARQNLRQLLVSLKRSPSAHGLVAEATRLRFGVATDVQEFRLAAVEGRLNDAVELYAGAFLQGFTLPDCPEFEQWLEAERRQLHEEWRETVLRFAGELEAGGRILEAARVLERVVKADPFDEGALRRLLRALIAGEQLAKARGAFMLFRENLRDEMGAEPEPATIEFAKLLHRRMDPDTPVQHVRPEARPEPRNQLPKPTTPFVGREAELMDLSRLMQDPATRLITVTAPGGMGKTRFVIEAATRNASMFRDGVFFAACLSVTSPDRILFAVADALSFAFFGQREPKEQLLEFLRDKELLVVVDNLEHLLAGVGVLGEVLESAPGVKVLATSRERLNLHAESKFDLHGLSVPEGDDDDGHHDAVRLFVQAAQRVRGEFKTDARLPVVARICRSLYGMPLALELAASWSSVLTLEDIEREIERSIDVLQSSAHDLPARHRSVRAVFDSSWELLAEDERSALMQLAVFPASFTREAAEHSAGAGYRLLGRLIDKSFLSRGTDGRYRTHPLALQYSLEKLRQHPALHRQAAERHARYYFDLVTVHHERAVESNSGSELSLHESEFPNVQAAWTRALESGEVQTVAEIAHRIERAYGRHIPEAEHLFRLAADALNAEEPTHQFALMRVHLQAAGCLVCVTRIDEATLHAQRALRLLEGMDEPRDFAAALYCLGECMWLTGEFAKAKEYYSKVLEFARGREGFGDDRSWALLRIVLVEREYASFPDMQRMFLDALVELQDGGPCAYAHARCEYGIYLMQHGNLSEGEGHVQEALRLVRRVHEPRMVNYLITNAARAATWIGDLGRAEALALEARAKADELHMRDVAARVFLIFGEIAFRRRQYDRARHDYWEGLQLAWTWRHMFTILDGVLHAASLMSALGRTKEAVAWLGTVRAQPGFAHEHALIVERQLEQAQSILPPQTIERALLHGEATPLERQVSDILEILSTLEPPQDVTVDRPGSCRDSFFTQPASAVPAPEQYTPPRTHRADVPE
jgi:predicted ATPase/DNA-binding SARP family transcriptional activator